jgi:transposase
LDDLPESHKKLEDKQWIKATQVPAEYAGFQAGDTVSMLLGGSGDRFGYAIVRRGEKIGFNLFRIAPAKFCLLREEWNERNDRAVDDKSRDHELVAQLVRERFDLFQPVSVPELPAMRIRYLFDLRMDAMKERIACEQRLRQRVVGSVFFSEEGCYPEGDLEDQYLQVKANSESLKYLIKEEDARLKELQKAVEQSDVWKKVFVNIRGCGPRIAAPLIALIGDIRRFPDAGHFKSYCGVAPGKNGEFRRRKKGVVANWSGDIRQAMFLFCDQMNRNPESQWGIAFRKEKARLRALYPDKVKNEKDKWMYTDAHIHNKARWHALGLFCEWLYKEWTAIYNEKEQSKADAA